MKAIPYWVQRPDYSSTDHAAVEVAEGLRAFETHDWVQEWERYSQLEATEGEACLPSIGFYDPSGALLHVCPDAQGRATVHYHFKTQRKVLGFLPLKLPTVRTADGVKRSRVLKLIELFFDGRHDSILEQLGARPHSPGSGTARAEGRGSWTKPFTLMWRSAAIVYGIMMTIALFVYARRDQALDAGVFAQAALAATVVGFGVMPVYTGVVKWRHATYPRNTKPVRYWTSIVVTVSLGLSLFLLGIGVIGR